MPSNMRLLRYNWTCGRFALISVFGHRDNLRAVEGRGSADGLEQALPVLKNGKYKYAIKKSSVLLCISKKEVINSKNTDKGPR